MFTRQSTHGGDASAGRSAFSSLVCSPWTRAGTKSARYTATNTLRGRPEWCSGAPGGDPMANGLSRKVSRFAAASLIGLGAVVTCGASAAADFRCADLRPSASQLPAYQRADGQSRCEGFYDRNVSQPFIELMSLTAAPPIAQAGSTLEIGASRRWPTRLIVQPLKPTPFYRVDALIGPDQTVRWDAATMLGVGRLRLRDLGFLALAPELDGTMTVVPVSFTSATADASMPLRSVLRVSVPVARFAWRSLRLDGSDGSGAWRDIPGPMRFAWERVSLPLEMPADGHGMRVEVQATDADGKLLPLLRFNVRGPADVGS